MTTAEHADDRVISASEVADPYALHLDYARSAPSTLGARFKYLGPGMLMSAAVVGSGELITTTSMGSKAGFALMWLIIVSTAAKLFIQMELAKISIVTGEPGLKVFGRVPVRFGKASWINVLWILMDFAKMLQRGGIIGGAVAALSLLFPVVGDPLSTGSLTAWTAIALVIIVGVNVTNRYQLIERAAFILVVTFTLITVALVLSLPGTEFGWTGGDVVSGLSFQIPLGAAGLAIAVFGLTGVGADEMTTYTYWCIEKGYARWTGPNDGSPEWTARAKGWIKVMQLDLVIAWVITTVCTVSFYIMGAAVLHPQGLHPEGNELIKILSHMYTDTLGPWAEYLFLIGAVGVLGSTFLASTASVPRLWANNLSVLGVFKWENVKLRTRLIRIFTIVMPIIWAATYLGLQAPLIMVVIGGFGSAIFLVAVVAAVLYLRKRTVASEFVTPRSSILLGISTIAVLFVALTSFLELFGVNIA